VHIDSEIVCEINTPMEELPDFRNDSGETYRIINFEIEMKPCGITLEFAAWYRNQRQRALKIEPPFVQVVEPSVGSNTPMADVGSSTSGSMSPLSERTGNRRPDLSSSRGDSGVSGLDLALTRYDPSTSRSEL
jgi:hypothetical protein